MQIGPNKLEFIGNLTLLIRATHNFRKYYVCNNRTSQGIIQLNRKRNLIYKLTSMVAWTSTGIMPKPLSTTLTIYSQTRQLSRPRLVVLQITTTFREFKDKMISSQIMGTSFKVAMSQTTWVATFEYPILGTVLWLRLNMLIHRGTTSSPQIYLVRSKCTT